MNPETMSRKARRQAHRAKSHGALASQDDTSKQDSTTPKLVHKEDRETQETNPKSAKSSRRNPDKKSSKARREARRVKKAEKKTLKKSTAGSSNDSNSDGSQSDKDVVTDAAPNPRALLLERASLGHWQQRITSALELHLHFNITLSKNGRALAKNVQNYWPADYCAALTELIPLVSASEANKRLSEKMAERRERTGVRTWMVRELIREVQEDVGMGTDGVTKGRSESKHFVGRGGLVRRGTHAHGRVGRGGFETKRGGVNDIVSRAIALGQVMRGRVKKFSS